jgi:hypothetical protein
MFHKLVTKIHDQEAARNFTFYVFLHPFKVKPAQIFHHKVGVLLINVFD